MNTFGHAKSRYLIEVLVDGKLVQSAVKILASAGVITLVSGVASAGPVVECPRDQPRAATRAVPGRRRNPRVRRLSQPRPSRYPSGCNNYRRSPRPTTIPLCNLPRHDRLPVRKQFFNWILFFSLYMRC